MEDEFEVWRLHLGGSRTGKTTLDGASEESLYVKVGVIGGQEVAALRGHSLVVPNASRCVRPVQEEDLLRTPSGVWLMLLRNGMFDVGHAVRQIEGGVVVSWRLPPTPFSGRSPSSRKADSQSEAPPSQHRFATSKYTVIVGWDNPLQTFFAQVWPTDDEEMWGDEPELWVGCDLGQVSTVEFLEDLLRPFAELPPGVKQSLLADYSDRRACTPALPGLIRRNGAR
jgi:hypothetical protein